VALGAMVLGDRQSGTRGSWGGISLSRILLLPRCGGISWQTPQGRHIVWEGKLTCHISGDPSQLRGRARPCWVVVGVVEPEELFLSLSLGERGW